MSRNLRFVAISICLLLWGGFASAQAGFTMNPAGGGCSPLVVQFTNTSTSGYTTYFWDFGNFVTSVQPNPSVSYTTPGTYTITLRATGSSGTSTVTKTVTVYPPPTVSFTTTNVIGCAPLAVTFASTVVPNVAGNVTYYWDFGDGSSDNTPNPTHIYVAGGVFSVSLTVTNGKGCSQTVVQTNIITVYPKPAAGFSAARTTICTVPAFAQFTASASGAAPFTYSWNYGDGSPAGSGSNTSHTYTAAGLYNVTLYTTDSKGCKDTLVKQSYIEVLPNTASFTGPSMGCDSSSVSFKNTTSNSSQTEWLFGDASGPFYGDSAYHVYTRPGVYTVRMVTVVGNCSDTLKKQIVIHPKPIVTATHNIPCPPPGDMEFTAASTISGTTYTWSWANGGLNRAGDTVTRPYSTYMYDTAVVIGVSPAGCRDTFVMDTLIVRDLTLEMDFDKEPKGCIPLTIKLGAFAGTTIPCIPNLQAIKPACPYPYKVVSWTWVIDNTTTYNTPNPVITFTTTGAHVAMLTVVTENGCTLTKPFYIAAGDTIPPKFRASKDTACVSEPVTFYNQTGISTISYNWDYGATENDTNSNDYNGFHRYKWTGSHPVRLISDFNGCMDTITVHNAVYIRPGNAQWDDSIYCSPSKTVYFKDLSTGSTSHSWNFGDASPAVTTPDATHTFPAFGTYFVTKITYSSISGCRDTVGDSVRVLPLLLDLVASDTTLCMGDTLFLRPVWKTDMPWTSWYVRVNDFFYGPGLAKASPFTIDTLMTRPGYDTVAFMLSTRSGQCRDSVVKNRYTIRGEPRAGFRASPLVGCMPMMVTFTDTSHYTPGTQPGSRWWSFGDGDTVLNNTQTTQQYYDTAGLFTVKLRITDWIGCKDSVTKRNYIDVRHPDCDFNTNIQNSCKGTPLNFNNLSTGATYLNVRWYFGDGDSATSYHATHAYRDTGVFTVMLVVWDSTGCRDTMTRPNYIKITSPFAKFSLSDTVAVCPPLTVKFTSNAVGAAKYEWNFDNSGVAVMADPVSTFTAAGLYNVRLIVKDAAGCPDTAYAKVRVLGYKGALTYTPLLGCVPLKVDFTSSVWNVPSLVWDFADGVTLPATAPTASYVYTRPGKYVPRLIFSDGKGCTSFSDGLDTIKVDDVEAGFKAVPPCEKTAMQLFDTSKSYFSPIVNSRWDFGSSGVMTGNPVTRTYSTAGEYPVTLITTNGNGCKDTLTTTIRIYPLPKIVATEDTAVCPPDAIALSVTGGKTYVWAPGTSLSCTTCDNPQANPTAPGVWVVTGTDSIGCVNKDTVKIGMQAKATFKVVGAGTICLGEMYQLRAAGATLYNWTPAQDLDSPDSPTPVARPKTTTTYVVTGREGSCLADTHQVRVTVRPVPVVDAGGEQKVVAGNAVLLQASGTGILSVTWATDPTLSCLSCFAPEARPKQTTTYKITAYNEYGCTATDSVRVLVLCDGTQLFLPNTFTPNNDGQNETFYPQGVGIDRLNYFRIYSRWGELLYERTNMSINDEFAGWNGTHNGAKLNPDVYIYVLEARCDTGEPLVLKGDVTLIR